MVDNWITLLININVSLFTCWKQDQGNDRGRPGRKLFQVPDRESKSNSRYCLHKISKHKNRNVTRSLHSIDINRNSINLHPKPKHTITKTIVLSDRENKDSFSSRKNLQEQNTNKKRILNKIMKMNNRSLVQKLHTIQGDVLEQKQKKIIGCIQMMQGVLQQIQHEKSSRKLFKSIRYPTQKSTQKINQNFKEVRKEEKSKFEEYIQNVCKSRENSKILLIRKAKTRSTLITNEELKASIVVNPKKFETITNQKSQNYPHHPKRIPKVQIIVEKHNETKLGLDDMEVSAIDKVNQSSFISDCGKKELIGDLRDSRKNILVQIQTSKQKRSSSDCETGSGSKVQRCNNAQVNLRKLCKVKNSKKLKNIFPSGFF